MPASLAASAGRSTVQKIHNVRKRHRRSRRSEARDQIDPAPKLGTEVFKIKRFANTPFQLATLFARSTAAQETLQFRRAICGNCADEWKMPDDVPNARFHLDDRGRRHID